MVREPDSAVLLGSLRSQDDEMAALLELLARAESPSLDPATQEGPLAILAAELRTLGFRVRRVGGRAAAPHLYARPRARRRGAPRQLMIGHVDTVWPVGTLDEMPVRARGPLIRGPGVFDMKAGLVQMVFALRALSDLGIQPVATPLVLVNTDEEVGSGDSAPYIRMLARCAERVLVLEPAFGPDGRLKTGRKGVGRFRVTVHGRAAHAGIEPDAGVSAILELSHQVQRLFALNDPGRGITVNVGTIDGGLRPNVVAPRASALVDARVLTQEDADRVERAIMGLTPVQHGVTLEIEGRFGRPPMERTERNRALWRVARRAADQLGLELDEAVVGGASDGNFASLYAATLDGLGPVGAGAHAADEHVVRARMPERAALLALILAAPLEPGLES
jgi:glutamate carboxypeptidase